jgi:hypothetical protein
VTLPLQAVTELTSGAPEDGWRSIVHQALSICSAPLTKDLATKEVTKRDRDLGKLDHFLATSGWELWQSFGSAVDRNSDRLIRRWAGPFEAKALLILDGLSLGELPWLIQGAEARGFNVHSVTAAGSELPPGTNEFAGALGFTSRSQLQNKGGGKLHRLTPANTECVALPWADCTKLVDGSPNWVFWHQWPDNLIHDAAGAGQGLDQITRNAAEHLSNSDFWEFVERLAKGRRLIITSDHGYAATGLFFDAADEQAQFLKDTFKSGRSRAGKQLADLDRWPFVPPAALALDTPHGPHLLALGRWKWRSQGGYPTLAHGGLSLLEVLCPVIELTKYGIGMANKKQQLAMEIAKAVGAGKAVAMETVDFNAPNRPKTCLEVDFPILPVNQVASIEGSVGKPIYQMSKWWARRRSSVFRAMLIAAATKAPTIPRTQQSASGTTTMPTIRRRARSNI